MTCFQKAVRTVFPLLALFAGSARAQDIHFAHFYDNAAIRNPALTGIFSGDYRAGVNYRTQWGNISTPYQTLLLAAETRTQTSAETHDFFSYGLTITYDKAASIALNTLQIMPTVNYNKNLRDARNSYISVGFGGAYLQRSFDPSKVTTNSQYVNGNYDPTAGTGESFTNNRLNQFDLNAGISFNSSAGPDNRLNYYFGGALYHILRPKESFMENDQSYSRLTGKYTGQFGISFLATDHWGFTTHLNYLNQQPYQEWMAGGVATYFYQDPTDPRKNIALSAGAYYRFGDAIIPTFKVAYQRFTLTTSYDITTSALRNVGGNAMEISLYLRGAFRKRHNAADQIICPRFETEAGSPYELF